MKKKNGIAERLFENARNTPPEFDLNHIEEMVNQFSGAPPTPNDKNNWTKFINIKNGLIMSLSMTTCIYLISLFFTTGNLPSSILENKPTISENIYDVAETKNINTTTHSKTDQYLKEELQEEILPSKKHLNQGISIQEIQGPRVSPLDNKERQFISPNFNQTDSSQNEKPNNISDRDLKDELLSTESGKEFSIVTSNESGLDSEPISLGQLKLRRLKKILYKNLMADELIKSKYAVVNIDLPGTKIIINGKKINDDLFLKYQELTMEAGTGKYRKIKINRANIRVGDFTETGFSGEGYGKFTEEIESPYYPRSINDKDGNVLYVFEKENAELDALADRLLGQYYGGGAPPRDHVDLEFEALLDLHQNLYALVIKDGFIDSKEFPVIIEVDKTGIKVNGKIPTSAQLSGYQTMVTKYKIKPAAFRSIRLTTHQIKVGDFGDGQFTGSSSTIGDY